MTPNSNAKIKARFPAFFTLDYHSCAYADIDDLETVLTEAERLTELVIAHNLSEARTYFDVDFEDSDGLTRYQCSDLVVGSHNIYFQDHPRHGDGFAETQGIHLNMLRRLVQFCKEKGIQAADFTDDGTEFDGYDAWLKEPKTLSIEADESDEYAA